ncbi:MAG: cupredoxin domain-containing protein [Actinomycetota bacterium]
MSDVSPQAPRGSAEMSAAPGGGWSRLLTWCVAGIVVEILLTLLVFAFIPPLLVFAVLFVAAALWLRRSPRPASIALIVLLVLYLVMNIPFRLPTLAVPASVGDFVTSALVAVLGVTGLVAAVALLRRRGEGGTGGPRRAGAIALGLLGIAVVVSVAARVSYEEAEARPGDIELAAEDFEFTNESLQTDAGRVSVTVTNEDQTWHTFTIESLDVDLDIPAATTARVTFDAEPGTYEFFCRPHPEDMKGELQVR